MKGEKILICCIYHSLASSDADFLLYLEEILEEYVSREGTLILIGDFNIDMSKNTFYSGKLNKLILENGLYQKVSDFTRVTANTSTMIDLMITNNKNLKPHVHLTPKITDHGIITIDINTYIKKLMLFRYIETNFNELDFQIGLMETVWFSDRTDINILADQLISSIIFKLNEHAPLKENIIKSKWADKKWWTKDINFEI